MSYNCKNFSNQEDQILKYLWEEKKVRNWGMLVKIMSEQYSFTKNQKQYKERYKQLQIYHQPKEWTDNQQKELFALHNRFGNKWALIATYFTNKTDNCVKNHFFSKLRKSFRHLNKIIKTNFKKEFRQLKIGALYKIIEGFEEQFKDKPVVSKEVSEYCGELKDILIMFSNNEKQTMEDEMVENLNHEKEKMLIAKIIDFNRNYKKKTKKQKKQALQGVQLFKPVKKVAEEVNSGEGSEYEGIDHDFSQSQEQQMRSEKQDQELRITPNIIIKEDESIRNSNQSKNSSKIDIREDLLYSDDGPKSFDFFNNLGNDKGNPDFKIFRVQSSFRSYRSQLSQSNISARSKMDMFAEEDIRLSHNVGKMDEEIEESLFRSQKEPIDKDREFH